MKSPANDSAQDAVQEARDAAYDTPAGIALNFEQSVAANAANNHAEPVTPQQPVVVQRLLDNLPGLIGGVDWAIREKVTQGKDGLPFILLVLTANGVAHAQNFDAKAAHALVVNYAIELMKEDESLRARVLGAIQGA